MYRLLSNIDTPDDLRRLEFKDLDELATEIREFLLQTISKTGGHLASNLGVVELTLALHYAFDFSVDKLIWDVGHQAYVHKILTGRKDKMNTLRQLDGLSGFPKREESIYDVFDTGHSSTSVSAAVGMARARDIKKDKYNVVAVIGDGALTGGMSFEALNDVGKRNSKVIIILNDNEMSIFENIGGLATHLSKARTTRGYLDTKEDVGNFLDRIPVVGSRIKQFLRSIKESIKKLILPNMIFEELGFTYLGPIDGHNIPDMAEVFERAKTIDEPVLIHVCTKKGKGYKYAELKPNNYHGVSPFDIETGKPLKPSTMPSYSDIFGKKLCEMAAKDDKLVAISAAMLDGTGLCDFWEQFPDRIFDVGIAEQHAVTMAAGMAANGMKPVVAIYSSFFQRAYDQIVHDVATQNLHVVFAIDRAGIVGNDGETHQGVFDVSFFTNIPNMTVLAPSNYNELQMMLEYAINEVEGPVAIRYPRGVGSFDADSELKISEPKSVVACEGSDITIVSYGKMLENSINAAKLLKNHGINAEVINLRFLKPLDADTIIKSASKTKKILVVEENPQSACLYNKIFEILPNDVQRYAKTFPDIFIKQGNTAEIYKRYGLDSDGIAQFCIEKLV